jgi:Uma2 family endonuclease
MGMPAQETRWTAEMARALPDDGNRYEVLDGELFVSPAPSASHQRAVAHLWEILARYCREHGLGEAMISPADIEFSEERLLQPDVFVVPLIEGRRIRSWKEVTTLLLAAEVISPSTARTDRGRKRVILQDENVPDYWIVDLDARIFERWRSGDVRPETLSDTLLWHPVPSVPALVIDLNTYFESVLGE